MRVLIIDKTAGLEASHQRHQRLAQQLQGELHVFGPRHWMENGRPIAWHPLDDCAYTPHRGSAFGKGYYARAGYWTGLAKTIRAVDPQVIQLFEEPWSISAAQTAFFAGAWAPTARLFFYTWENIYRPWQYPARISLIYRFIDKLLHQQSHGAVCATQQAQAVLQRKGYAHPAAVIPYGIPDFFFAHNPSASHPAPAAGEPFRVGYIGRLLWMKGVDLLLEAIEPSDAIELLIAGSGEDEPALRQQAQARGLQNKIEWHGPIEERAVPALLSRLHALVLPSRATPNWQEQLGRVLIEAMAYGVPVIGAQTGAIPEVIGQAGLLFQSEDAQDLRARILTLRETPRQAQARVQRGRERARRFTWQRFARELTAFWRQTT